MSKSMEVYIDMPPENIMFSGQMTVGIKCYSDAFVFYKDILDFLFLGGCFIPLTHLLVFLLPSFPSLPPFPPFFLSFLTSSISFPASLLSKKYL